MFSASAGNRRLLLSASAGCRRLLVVVDFCCLLLLVVVGFWKATMDDFELAAVVDADEEAPWRATDAAQRRLVL